MDGGTVTGKYIPKTKKKRGEAGLGACQLLPLVCGQTWPKGAKDLVQWMEQYQLAFVQVKKALYGEPLLHTAQFSLPFIHEMPWIEG